HLCRGRENRGFNARLGEGLCQGPRPMRDAELPGNLLRLLLVAPGEGDDLHALDFLQRLEMFDPEGALSCYDDLDNLGHDLLAQRFRSNACSRESGVPTPCSTRAR